MDIYKNKIRKKNGIKKKALTNTEREIWLHKKKKKKKITTD